MTGRRPTPGRIAFEETLNLMSVLLLTHPACLDHETGSWHPESPARLRAVLKALEAPEFSRLVREDAPAATEETLSLAHDPAYVRAVLAAIPAHGAEAVHLDADTVVSPGSGEAALRAAGAVVAAVDAVMTGRFDRAFCAIRPPGHHAEPGRPMGFCLFNNVAVGALHARAAHKVNRIAVVDFDVHHGNGTQAIFQNDPDLFYGSIHQAPFYPGTGKMSERGVAGNILNIPFGAGSGGIMVRRAFIERLIPALDEFMPDLLLVSAGFDAHHRDPVGGMDLGTEDFAWMTKELIDVARRHSGGRIISTLEGGYDLRALADAAASHVHVLMTAP